MAFLVSLCCVGVALAQFETRTSVPIQSPGFVAVGDFNHDGKLDAAVASDSLYTDVMVLLGNGDGPFKPPVLYQAGEEPVAIAAADLNHDGNLDLVVGNYLSSNISVSLGKGDGTFQAAVNYGLPALGSATFVAVADVNNDGKPDIVAVDQGQCGGSGECVVVFLGNGDGTFQTTSINTSSGYDLSEFAVGDFNNDGNLDLAVSEYYGGANQLQILFGNGDGTFSLGPTYLSGLFPRDLQAAYLDNDRNLDLVVSVNNGMAVLLGNGDGTFRGPTIYPPVTSWLTVADINGDGIADVVATEDNTGSQAVVFFGKGDGTFQPAKTFGTGREPGFIVTGDFNGDRRPDLVFTDGGPRTYYLATMLNTGVVTFSPTTPLNFGKQTVGTTSPAKTVTLTNTGKSALTISSMKSTGQFGMTSTCGTSLAPGANCAINVTFSPTSKGPKSGTVSIKDSASSKPQVIELSGTGT